MAGKTIQINCTERTTFGKGAARQVRREGGIPAVVYGHGEGPFHVVLPGHEAFIALRHTNALMTLTWGSGEDRLVLAKDVQRDPIKPIIEHVDFVIVNRHEKVDVDVTIHVEGEAAPETVVSVPTSTVTVSAPVLDIPESIVVSVEGAEAGTLVHASDLELPEGVELVTDPEETIVNVSETISAEALEAELAEAEEEAGIEHDESDEEAAEAAESEGGEDEKSE
ncbi:MULTISPECIES: 50S ribosomal protein L25/general stress protein Ctc [Kytococcus]|uniref:Large ribosomal subunit protein bL25 n=1 Tax=Kytococcus schroeteri TaxID=138300 RepID=A0A2I1P8A0_9MICO|nr:MULTISPECIES: 50S ribosomal protein L25/general stress protein Ctc [Kytococcus]OFS15489.1 50S ribosomal protein L25/general stress protein Ctc [Kytococcus sp. HMSC28H12]PKZ40856.1 50S ribosomal protein L25 [Kytococcus schroeteri]